MGDWNWPRHLVLAVSSKIKVMCHSCIFIVFLIQCILSHLQHNIIECMRGVYVLAKHSSFLLLLLRPPPNTKGPSHTPPKLSAINHFKLPCSINHLFKLPCSINHLP